MILLVWILGFIGIMALVGILLYYAIKPSREERINDELRGENL